MRILLLVCSNGLGHFRRASSILATVLKKQPSVTLSVACAHWQVKRLGQANPLAAYADRIEYQFDVVEPGVQWSNSPAEYNDGRLVRWADALVNHAISDYDAVISDNLAGILAHREDSILIGSFLWSDVLEAAYPENNDVREFVRLERELLKSNNPSMICLGPLAMPGVLTRTSAVKCGFMPFNNVREDIKVPTPPFRLAVLGGAAGSLDDQLAHYCSQIGESSDFELVASRKICQLVNDSNVVTEFGFEFVDYQTCDAIIARPGMGTIHDALAAGVPMLAAYEYRQAEMRHLASRLDEFGLAFDLGCSQDVEVIEHYLRKALSENWRAKYATVRKQLTWGGISQAANWLINHLQLRSRPVGA